jgi:O-antigen ligase
LDKASTKQDQRGLIFAAVAGFFFFITLLKWGNPVILDNQVSAPLNIFEFLYQSWPVNWGYICMLPVVIVGVFCVDLKIPRASAPLLLKSVLVLPLAWLIWQFISATHTVDVALTTETLKHFTACVILFYLGYFALGRLQNPWPVWLFLSIALLWIAKVGFEQHFGGLDETRKYFYSLPDWQKAPPEFIKKLSSTRIYSTLFYPNTLAGVLLLVVPITLGFVWDATTKFQSRARCLILALIAAPSIACLYWSQSKAGWLIALLLLLVALLMSKLRTSVKLPIIIGVVTLGVLAFVIRHGQYFERGSTSVVARFDYWRAAIAIGCNHPLFGTGPGTFAIPYATIKSPDAEMARLAHNDFIEQFSDSGIMGFTMFLTLFAIILAILYRYRNQKRSNAAFGLLAVILHQSIEFHLYVPAIAWLTFLLFGWITRASQTFQPDLLRPR